MSIKVGHTLTRAEFAELSLRAFKAVKGYGEKGEDGVWRTYTTEEQKDLAENVMTWALHHGLKDIVLTAMVDADLYGEAP